MTNPEQPLDPQTAVTVGRIIAPHGVRGELKVEPLTDFPRALRGRQPPLAGRHALHRRARALAATHRHPQAARHRHAQPGRGRCTAKTLLAPEATPIEDEDVYYLHDILGARVQDTAGEALGELADVFSTGSNDVYVVRGPRGELLLPALDDVVLEVDVKAHRIVVEIPEGLEFTAPAPPKRRRPPVRKKPAKSGGTAGP